MTPLKYKVFENIMENGALDAPLFIIFSKVFETLLIFFLIFSMLSKIETDVMI